MCPYLKLRPVHAHAWSMGVSPPSQIFSVIGCSDRLTQIPVQVLEPIGQRDAQIFAAHLRVWEIGQDAVTSSGELTRLLFPSVQPD